MFSPFFLLFLTFPPGSGDSDMASQLYPAQFYWCDGCDWLSPNLKRVPEEKDDRLLFHELLLERNKLLLLYSLISSHSLDILIAATVSVANFVVCIPHALLCDLKKGL